MSTPIKKVLVNCAQNFSDAEKLQARTNIGAIGGVRVTDTSGTTDLVPDEQGRVTVDLTNAGKVQSDWEETNPNEASYIKNKPTIPPAPVQSDWAEDDDSSLAFIQNKPENLVQDADYVHTDNNFTDTDKDKLDGIEAGAEKNVQADWNQSNSSADDYIKNKPSIPDPQVQSDWNQTNSAAVDYIKNKPANLVQDANYVHTDNNFTDNDKDKLDGIEAGAEKNVQADWNQSNSSADDYIKNKPTIPQPVQSDWTETDSADPSYIQNKPNLATVATSGSYNDLSDKPDIPSQQVQSDWTETDTADPAYIKNKPAAMETKPLIPGTNIEFVSGNESVTINAKATKVVTRSAPYTTAVELSEMGVYDPGQDYGSVVKDQGGNTIGFFAPKHYGEADVGKVLQIVNDSGYKMEWRQPAGGGMELKPLSLSTQPLTSSNPVTLTIADGYAYELEMQTSLSSVITLDTPSTDTIHSLIYVTNHGGNHCGTITLKWRDAALEEHTVEIDMTETEYTYCFDVYIRKVTHGNAQYAIATVHDYPVAYRNSLGSFTTTNETTQMVGVWL